MKRGMERGFIFSVCPLSSLMSATECYIHPGRKSLLALTQVLLYKKFPAITIESTTITDQKTLRHLCTKSESHGCEATHWQVSSLQLSSQYFWPAPFSWWCASPFFEVLAFLARFSTMYCQPCRLVWRQKERKFFLTEGARNWNGIMSIFYHCGPLCCLFLSKQPRRERERKEIHFWHLIKCLQEGDERRLGCIADFALSKAV